MSHLETARRRAGPLSDQGVEVLTPLELRVLGQGLGVPYKGTGVLPTGSRVGLVPGVLRPVGLSRYWGWVPRSPSSRTYSGAVFHPPPPETLRVRSWRGPPS